MKRSAALLISLSCNLRCPYCFAQSTMGPSGFMSFAAFRNAVDFIVRGARAHDEVKIRLAGGEPTLNPEFKRMLGYLKRLKGLKVQLLTNGTFKREILKDLLTFDRERLSLLVNVNDPRRIGGRKFSTVKRNVAALSTYNTVIGINFFSPRNSWRYVTDMATEHGLKIRWSLTHPVGGDHLFVTPSNFKAVGKTVLGFLKECSEGDIPTNADCSTPLCLFEGRGGMIPDLTPGSTFCNPPVVIDPDLNVFLCYEQDKRKLSSFRSAAAMFRHFEAMKKGRGSFFWLKECRTCSYRDFMRCGGGCPYHAQQANDINLASIEERGLRDIFFHFNLSFRECSNRKGARILKDLIPKGRAVVMDRFMYDMVKACRKHSGGRLSGVFDEMRKAYRSLNFEEFVGVVQHFVGEGYLNVWAQVCNRGRR